MHVMGGVQFKMGSSQACTDLQKKKKKEQLKTKIKGQNTERDYLTFSPLPHLVSSIPLCE